MDVSTVLPTNTEWMDEMYDHALNEIAERLRDSQRVLFITGAGISADSGLPTYRGVGGLYNQERTGEGYSIEECLSGTMFRVRPEITWKYMLQLGLAIAEHGPNEAHRILAKWEKEYDASGGKVVVMTQNIDGYHRAAGSRNVYEFHGSLAAIDCTVCSWTQRFELDENVRERLLDMQKSLPPRCPECDAVIRPRIVLFEEMLPVRELEAFQREFESPGFDVVFAIGTSAMFPYITGPIRMAARAGIPTVEINPAESELSRSVQIHLPMRAAEALSEIDKRR